MPAQSPSSSVQQTRELLGRRLQDLREAVEPRLTKRELGERCGWSESKTSRIEAAKTRPSKDDIRRWCHACEVEDQIPDLLALLQDLDAMYVTWSKLHGSGLSRQQESRLPLYERTRRFRAYSPWLVPGVLQTRGYTTEVLRSIMRRTNARDDVEEAVQSRMRRQSVLHEGDHRFSFVIEESVLRTSVCPLDIMAEQLDHLAVCASLPSVSLGIIPMGANRNRWPVEGFWIFDEERVNVELVGSYLTITQPREIADYARAFADLKSMAVFGSPARSLLGSALDALG